MNESTPALALESLSKKFGRIHAVDQLSLEVPAGQMSGFLGPNGAGKSTTLYMIPRLVRPTSGHIRIFGVDIWEHHKNAIGPLGIMVEAPAFYEYLSARLNLELAARVLGNVGARDIDETLERIGLADRQQDRVGTFSTGTKQRLGIGRAMLSRPRLLILDEPTNGMDPEGTQEILSFLREKVQSDGLTVFISSHLMSEIEEFCDTVFVINHGRLIASGNVRDILKPREQIVRVSFQGRVPSPETLTRCTLVSQVKLVAADTFEVMLTGGDSAQLNEWLLQEGLRVVALTPKQRTLKEFFLSITGDMRHE